MSVLPNESEEPVTRRDQLLQYFTGAVKPKANWLIGCEHEKFPYRLSTLKPVGYFESQGINDLLTGMQQFGWKPVMEGQNIIGLTRGKSAISLEPGGQFELAGAPLKNLHDVDLETRQHIIEVNEIGGKLGIGFLGMGFHPIAKREDIQFMPKGRYKIMSQYMPKRGKLGLDMMLRTCTVQVNLDFASEADMIKKFRASLALQPIATALFASSPIVEGKVNGFNSNRMNVWTDTDPDRSGPTPFAFEDGFGFERYTDYALDVPMYFVHRKGTYIDCTGQSFHDFLKGKLPALPGEVPTMNDWANHLTTLFPDVRLKKIIEMRGADVGMTDMLAALPAFWVGVLYDDMALDAASELVKDWTPQDRKQLHDTVPHHGMKTNIRGITAAKFAQEVLKIAKDGLRRRTQVKDGADETQYLDPLFEFAESGQNRADHISALYKQNPNMQGIFDAGRLLPQG